MRIAARRLRRRVVACRGNPRALLARQKSHHRRPIVSYDTSQNKILFLQGKARFGLANPGSNFEMKPATRWHASAVAKCCVTSSVPGKAPLNNKFYPTVGKWTVYALRAA